MNKTLASIESFTGGKFADRIVSHPGASEYFKGSIVTYATEVKEKLGINVEKGTISSMCAYEMSKKGREFFDVEVCVSFTGNAGPDVMEDQPVGLCFIAINNEVYEINFTGERNEIRKQAVDFAMDKLKEKGFIF
ncbi:nicotinamide-nucleotide amidase [Metamycoplasma subdolum]|uniref:Nicotinamide-nucleotide amidase n=1 Tax=Metamycoplasma subdolum TaxID=92407 RepID=A0A3M0A041_9BACT|nr:nicotinamide-nucleotide amidohydrolase family protein [Metamycoplasma subdolum]RMA78491.1 nicotinamide-nucleotide amidase [Metamycoplasma subdolum]WPB50423.1 nicotinamide-nucleotide amidohydrolase family protein [Metamycoplasma subdolum]